MKITEYDKSKLIKTKLAQALYQKLHFIYDNEMWVLGILDEVFDNDNKIKKLLNIIDNGETDADEIFTIAEEL